MRRVAFVSTAALISLYGTAAYYAWCLPDNYYVDAGSRLEVSTLLTIDATPSAHYVQTASSGSTANPETALLRLFGVVPIKQVEVQEIDTPMLVLCGQPYGIKLRMGGAIVVGMGDVEMSAGACCPAQEAGIQTGDLIESVNGTAIDSNQSLQQAVDASDGDTVSVTLLRGDETITCALTPAFAIDDGYYEADVWVRDSSAGIGTITYYDPASGTFGGLGHPVCDADTGDILPIGSRGSCCGHDHTGYTRQDRRTGHAPGDIFARSAHRAAHLQQPLRHLRDARILSV